MERSEDSNDIVAVREARAHARRMFDDDGVEWRVFELTLGYDRRGPSLVFESDSIMRRVRAFPTDWRSLSDEALLALSRER